MTHHIEETLAAILMGLMTLIVTVDVFGRYFFDHPMKGFGELAILLFVWQVFLAGAAALRRGLHVSVDFLVVRLPARGQATVALIVNGCLLIMVVIAGMMGWRYAYEAQTMRIQTLHLPYTYAIMAVPLGCLLMSFHLIKHIYQAIRGVITRVYEPTRQGFAGTGCIMPEDRVGEGVDP
jgi:TRAP-type C4-dicarboxylate transport system permease small subunit